MSRRRRSSPVGPIVAAIVASVFAHLVLWPVGDRLVKAGRDGTLPERKATVMEVTFGPDPSRTPPTDPEDVKKTVRLDNVVNEERPDDTDRTSEFDNKVERETIAPTRRRTPPMAPQGNPKATDDRNAAPKARSASEAAKPGARALPLGGTRSSGVNSPSVGQGERSREPSPPAPAIAPSPRSLKGVPGSRAKTWGAPGTTDRVDDVDEGDATILNTQRWKYASFFNRMKDDIDQYWDPVARLKARDPDGRINGTKTRTTRVMIILNADGSLDKIRLQRGSGVDYLDDEAIRAIRSAAPFPNPPRGMLDPSDNKLHVPFGFVVEMGKGRIFRIRR